MVEVLIYRTGQVLWSTDSSKSGSNTVHISLFFSEGSVTGDSLIIFTISIQDVLFMVGCDLLGSTVLKTQIMLCT